MSQYRHGVFIDEVPTSLVTPVTAESAMPVIVGTAPVHNLKQGNTAPINEPRLIYSMSDFVAQFGAPAENESKADYTLYQAAEIYLTRYKVAPLVAINVFDPAVHCTQGEGENAPDIPAVSLVDETDIIGTAGGINSGKRTGLALVEEVFPRFRLVPGQVLAPRFSTDPTVAIAIGAACRNISGHFRATGIFEVPDSVSRHNDVPAWLADNNLTDPNLLCMYGNALYGNIMEPGSIHLAGCIGLRDAGNEGIPFWSPSNTTLKA